MPANPKSELILEPKRKLWAFLFPLDMGADAADGDILAAFEHPDNKDREWPVEKLTPDELSERLNNEDHAYMQQYVRFIEL